MGARVSRLFRRQPAQVPEPIQYNEQEDADGYVVVGDVAPAAEGIEIAPGGNRRRRRGSECSLTDSERVPHGSIHYSFKAVQPPELPEIPGITQKEVITWRDEINARYKGVLERRMAIHRLLNSFRNSLGLPEDSDLPVCFSVIKKAAGMDSRIEIVDENPPRLTLDVDDETWRDFPEEYKEAIRYFNDMLRASRELLNDRDEIIQYVEVRLQRLKDPMSHTQIRATVETYDKLKDIPEQIRQFGEELMKLLHDVAVAKNEFAIGFNPTGQKLLIS